MSGDNCNRYRNRTVSFRTSPMEHRDLEARVEASGIAKNKYILNSCLYGQIVVIGSRKEIDKLINKMNEMELALKQLVEKIESEEYKKTSQEIELVRNDYCCMVKAIVAIIRAGDEQVTN